MRITRTLATALGIAAIAASTAQARPIEDIHTPLIESQSAQSLQPDHAGNTQSPGHPSEVGRPDHAPGHPSEVDSTSLAGPSPAPSQPAAPAQPADGGNGVDWLTVALGIGGSLLAVSGIAALNARRTRVPA